MGAVAVHERLRLARSAAGEDLSGLAERTGLRVHHLRAIEDGRFADLPRGIYARSTIRAFATAYGLDPFEVLSECEALLPPLDDPIDAMARAHGVRDAAGVTAGRPDAPPDCTDIDWRPLAAAALDAAFAGVLTAVVAGGAALLLRTPIDALRPAAGSLALVVFMLAVSYFAWFGGLVGTTIGGLALRLGAHQHPAKPLTLPAIAAKALTAATADGRTIRDCGVWVVRRVRARQRQDDAVVVR